MSDKPRTPADALRDPRPGDVSDTAPQPPPVPTDSEPIYRQVIADIEAKAEVGRQKYGTYLQADNGRDHLADAYQEGIDGIKYLKCAIVERRALLDRIAALEAVIEADRTRIIDAVNALERVVNGKFWLTEGRGSYEWDDDRYREEFGEAVRSMLKAVEPLRKIGADLTNCPQTTAEVIKAREDKDAKIAALEAQLAEAQARLERIHAIVTRLLAEPGNHTEQLVEIATICEARADELEGKS